ncbi:cytochrome [Streptomyces sp. CB00316]|uniref:cytochrome P450 n=1 Tax=unclassified Streptomyces TaxID=2593676 RepID=UPI00093E79F8|nr:MULTISPECIES: cytochrome P450 [unclassified Streptomyces]MBT2379140.1 cytochrome P450 [Streptomyces sp. ISL-111]MBT2426802.1 cytochrome P450 [Streptomyces sp. ISL-112]MBT2461895.1 cytochrome P450 [Streptomyces sp. ISL-63]OKJ22457.1 cytochrome [Streptomyces sp. CB00316]
MTIISDATAQDPTEELFSWFRTKLDTTPVYRDEEKGWQVFGYDDIARILADTTTFSSDTARSFNPPQPDLDFFDMGNLVTTDPPRHRQLRSLINSGFTPRAVAGLTPMIERITHTLLDAVDGADRFDLIDSVAYALPITVICELLGLPMEDEPLFRVWGEALGTVDAATVPPDQLRDEVAPAVRDMNAYLMDQVRRRRKQPTDDVISKLANAEVDGRHLEDGEIVGITGLTMFAGHATTMALIANAVLLFDRHPEAGAAVRADRSLLRNAAEEVLRLRPPFPRLARVVTADTEIGGHAIAAGELVTPWIGAGNRDASRFPDPDRFDIHRHTGSSLVFGQGIHFCLGAPLARLEGRIALDILMDRYADIAVDANEPVEFENPWQLITPKRLPVRVS